MTTTNHSYEINILRDHAKVLYAVRVLDIANDTIVDLELSADLLELHDRQSLSLDEWDSAKAFVKRHTGRDVQPNGV